MERASESERAITCEAQTERGETANDVGEEDLRLRSSSAETDVEKEKEPGGQRPR